MKDIIIFFETIPSSWRAAFLIGGLALFWSLESIVPLLKFSYHKWKHAGINIFFTLTTVLINLAFASLLYLSSHWAVNHSFGIVQWLQLPLWAEAILGLLLLDLIGAYLIHYLEHRVRWMWRFHIIHHSDPYVDTTTANRHHPVESVFRAIFTTLAVLIAGAPMWLVMLYQSLSVLFSQFNHANIRLPEKVDKWLSYLIVSPNMHKVHHHYRLPLTDTNYGNIFSIWDRLFGTYAFCPPQKLHYGIDTHPKEEEHSRILRLLSIPFEAYRPASPPETPEKREEKAKA